MGPVIMAGPFFCLQPRIIPSPYPRSKMSENRMA